VARLPACSQDPLKTRLGLAPSLSSTSPGLWESSIASLGSHGRMLSKIDICVIVNPHGRALTCTTVPLRMSLTLASPEPHGRLLYRRHGWPTCGRRRQPMTRPFSRATSVHRPHLRWRLLWPTNCLDRRDEYDLSRLRHPDPTPPDKCTHTVQLSRSLPPAIPFSLCACDAALYPHLPADASPAPPCPRGSTCMHALHLHIFTCSLIDLSQLNLSMHVDLSPL
jgi:hypothetical protein